MFDLNAKKLNAKVSFPGQGIKQRLLTFCDFKFTFSWFL